MDAARSNFARRSFPDNFEIRSTKSETMTKEKIRNGERAFLVLFISNLFPASAVDGLRRGERTSCFGFRIFFR
jgi:hypothetical protein